MPNENKDQDRSDRSEQKKEKKDGVLAGLGVAIASFAILAFIAVAFLFFYPWEKFRPLKAEDTGENLPATSNADLRTEIAEEIAKAMEPFQRLLTNPPPLTVVTQATQSVATPQASVAMVTPPGVTNNNIMVVNLPPPPMPQPITAMPPPPAVVFQNNNKVVVRALPPSLLLYPQSVTTNSPPPYWLRKLW